MMRPPATIRWIFAQTSFCRFSYLASGVLPPQSLCFLLERSPHASYLLSWKSEDADHV